jgi:hypothetical protein
VTHPPMLWPQIVVPKFPRNLQTQLQQHHGHIQASVALQIYPLQLTSQSVAVPRVRDVGFAYYDLTDEHDERRRSPNSCKYREVVIGSFVPFCQTACARVVGLGLSSWPPHRHSLPLDVRPG